jgi:hypothetical protein
LGDTPFRAQPIPVGSEVTLTFRMDGFRTTTVTTLIEDNTEDDEQPRFVIGPVLDIYAPPVVGDPWSDSLGMPYKAVDSAHVSLYYVGEDEWQAFKAEAPGRLHQSGRRGEVRRLAAGQAGVGLSHRGPHP